VTSIETSAFAVCESLEKIYVHSQTIASSLASNGACGNLIFNAKTVYLVKGLTPSNYVTTNYAEVEEVSIDGVDYVSYTLHEECADTDKDHKCDACGNEMGTHLTPKGEHNCHYCGERMTECVDEDKDHKCDVCSENVGEHKAAKGKSSCDYCGAEVSAPKETEKNDEDGKIDVSRIIVTVTVITLLTMFVAVAIVVTVNSIKRKVE